MTGATPLLAPASPSKASRGFQKSAVELDSENSNEYYGRLLGCFAGIMVSFITYNLLLEKMASQQDEWHELSFLFVSSLISTVVAVLGRWIRQEPIVALPWLQFLLLGGLNLGSSFCSVRSLRYVIFPVKVIAKSCKPVPVMLMGTVMGKKYPLSKYLQVLVTVSGVALVLGGGGDFHKANKGDAISVSWQVMGLAMLAVSLCLDGGLGAFEDYLVASTPPKTESTNRPSSDIPQLSPARQQQIQSFDLMYNIHLSNVIFAAIGIVAFQQLPAFWDMMLCMGWRLLVIGLFGAVGQVFIFVTLVQFGALTCSIMGLARKVTTICASIYFYGHDWHWLQLVGLIICIVGMAGKPFLDLYRRSNGGSALTCGSTSSSSQSSGWNVRACLKSAILRYDSSNPQSSSSLPGQGRPRANQTWNCLSIKLWLALFLAFLCFMSNSQQQAYDMSYLRRLQMSSTINVPKPKSEELKEIQPSKGVSAEDTFRKSSLARRLMSKHQNPPRGKRKLGQPSQLAGLPKSAMQIFRDTAKKLITRNESLSNKTRIRRN
eukprot:CAMPEP_0172443906 /NCGR_PEP_ID=MMETSP1065-20121228/4085_1 /TAXON_ID=265537 /ORGANISM="Amphiprora paludosa, Strain CCMP125" /LENGTH=545 /DNA_ID=CAMNT_0013194299 /DNA_START=130 /DNA_END=1767 /DNA_ORIENTATION=-